MRFACTTPAYAAIYARWLANPGGLLDFAGYTPGERLLDLCGGTGAVSQEALRRGADPASIMLVDLNPRCPDPIRQETADANGVFAWGRQFDLIVIRQAAAYLDWDRGLVTHLWRLLATSQGRLVFNLFVRPKWSAQTYRYEGRRFFEASGYFGRTVWHVQAGRAGVDVSRFRWLDTDDLRHRLERWFVVEVQEKGASQRWLCTPKDKRDV